MVKFGTIHEAVQAFRPKSRGFVGVFPGGTSGIGEATVKAFSKYSEEAYFYIIGRNEAAAKAIIEECQRLSPTSKFVFLQQDLSVLKNVDKVCAEILKQVDHIDLLFMTMGYLSTKRRNETPEGLDTLLTLRYYARMRFTTNLLPLLTSSPSARVISIFAPGKAEHGLNLSDLGLAQPSNYGVVSGLSHASFMTTIFFEQLAARHPCVSFLHVYPGYIITGEFVRAEFPLLLKWLVCYVIVPFLQVTGQTYSYEEVGERMLFNAVSGRYPALKAAEGGTRTVGVPEGMTVITGSDGQMGSGAYCVTSKGERVSNDKSLAKYRNQNAKEIIWEHTTKILEEIKSL